MRRLVLEGDDPTGWGHQHGETLRAEIEAAYKVRLELVLQKTDLRNESEAVALCEKHIPILQRFDDALMHEMVGIGEGAGLSLSQIILLNHYTDLRDLRRHHLSETGSATLDDDGDQGCSVIFAPTAEGPLLGQTWDMHGSATDFVWLLDVPTPTEDEKGRPSSGRTLLFTLSGCVGMTGLTSWGLGMTINNLNSLDAGIGIVWPALVRRTLRAQNANEARDLILGAPLGSGHHYVVADARDLFGIETSGQKKKVIQTGISQTHLHTNHCLDPEMAPTCRILASSTTEARYQKLVTRSQTQPISSLEDMWDSLAEVSHPRQPEDAHAVATCGAFCMNLERKQVWACQGIPAPTSHIGNAPQSFDMQLPTEKT